MPTADCSFHIGKTHHVCEDYAFANVFSEISKAIAMVSDGCSGSKNTDFGSRILIKSAVQQALLHPKRDLDCILSIYSASEMIKKIGLSIDSLDATLLSLVTYPEDEYSEFGYCVSRTNGDGVVVTVSKLGVVCIYDYSYPSGMPFYPSYNLDRRRLCEYISVSNRSKIVLTNYTNWIETSKSSSLYPNHSFFGYNFFSIKDYSFVAVMSDGVHSFQRKDEVTGKLEAVDFREVIKHLIDIKNYNGEFMKRRCNRFLRDFCVKNNWQHTDDFSIAAIHFG